MRAAPFRFSPLGHPGCPASVYEVSAVPPLFRVSFVPVSRSLSKLPGFSAPEAAGGQSPVAPAARIL